MPNKSRLLGLDNYKLKDMELAGLRIRIRIRIRMLLGLLDPDPNPLVRGMDPDPSFT